MVISSSGEPLAEVVETIRANLKGFDVKCLIKLHNIFKSSKGGPQEAKVLKSIFEIVVHIYESQGAIAEDHDIQCHLLVGECYEYLLNVLKKNNAHDKDLCLKSIDVLIALTKRQSSSFIVIFKFVSNSLLDIITCPQLIISERKEFMKALNYVLENTDRKTRYKVRDDLKIEKLSKLLYTCGDYETQANLIETIFRYTSMEERKILARKWLNDNPEILTSFLSIKDFEPDCRKFLIKFNNSLRDGTLVYSLPCLTTAIGKCELHKPEDPNCEEFWIDFNLGSGSVSIVCSQESLYSQSVYGSEVTPGFWETINVECQSVSKVSLQDATLFPAHGRIKEDAFEICMTLLQPCHILFSFPSNFEGNMIVITFSMRYLKKIQMLIQRLFPENHFFNVRKKFHPRNKMSKSSVALLSQGSIISQTSTESENGFQFNSKPVRRPTSGNNSNVHPRKDSARRSLPSCNTPKGSQLEEKKFKPLSRSSSKSPYKPLEIVISPRGHKAIRSSGIQSSGLSNLRTPEAFPLDLTQPEANTSGKSTGSKDTGFYTLAPSLPDSLPSEKQNGTKKDISKDSREENQISILSHQKHLGATEKENYISPQKIPILDATNNTKPESSVNSEVINRRVLRSQKRLPVKGNVHDGTQATTFCPEMRKNQFQENNTSRTERSQRVTSDEKSPRKGPKITSEGHLITMRENSHEAGKGNSFSSHYKQQKNTFFDSSDTESGSSWMKLVRSGPKNKLTLPHKEVTNKPLIDSGIEDFKSEKCQGGKDIQECRKIPEQNKLQKSDGLENESGNKNCEQSREQNKRPSMRKKLFNSSDNTLMAPIRQSLDINGIAVSEKLQQNKPKAIDMRARETLDPSMSKLKNWMSGTESELSWLQGSKPNELSRKDYARRSYQGNREKGRKLGGKLNHTVKSFIELSTEEETNRNQGKVSPKNSRGNFKTRKGLGINQDEVLESSSDEDCKKKGRPKKGKQNRANNRKGASNKGKSDQSKRNTMATSRKQGTSKNSPPQHDFVVETESSARNENVISNNINGQRKTISEKKVSSALEVDSISESRAPISEKGVNSNEKNYSPNTVKNNSLIAANNPNPKSLEKSPTDLDAYELPCKDKMIDNESTNLDSFRRSSKEQNKDHHSMGFQKSPHSQGNSKNQLKNSPLETPENVLTKSISKSDHSHSFGIELKGKTTSKCEEASSDCLINISDKRMVNRLSIRKPAADSSNDNIMQNRTGKKGCQANGSKMSPNLESNSQRMRRSMQDGALMRETAVDTTHNIIIQGRTGGKGHETHKSTILSNLESHLPMMNKSMQDHIFMRESASDSTLDNVSRGRTKKTSSDEDKLKCSPNLASHSQQVNKSMQEQLLMRESIVNVSHDNILHGRNMKQGCEIGKSHNSPNLESEGLSSKSETPSSDDDEEICIQPSLVEMKNTSLPIFSKSLPGKKGILNSKNITTKRGSYFITPNVEERKKMKHSSIKDSIDAKGYLGNNYFSPNASTYNSQGQKRGNQDDESQNLAGLTSTAACMPTKRFKGWEEKLHDLLAEEEVSSPTPEKLLSESQDEIELDILISEFDSTSKKTQINTKGGQDKNVMQAEKSTYTLKMAVTDPEKNSGPEQHSTNIISIKRGAINPAQSKKRRVISNQAKLEKQNSMRKSYPHLLKETMNEISFPDYNLNCSVDPILDIGRTIQQLFKRHNTIKNESLNDIRHRLLNLTARASEDFRQEYIRESSYFSNIDGHIKNLHDSLERENSLTQRFEKCYKYLYNTSMMKSQNDQKIKESLAKIRKVYDENAMKYSKQNDISMDDKYRKILMSKVEILKENFIQQEQKKEMVKNLQYVKSLILR